MYLRLGLNGFIYGYYAKQICEIIMLVYIICTRSELDLPILKQLEIKKNLYSNFKFVMCVVIGLYGELLTEEISTFFTAISQNIHFINSW